MLKTVRIFAVAAILWAPGWLHISRIPRSWTERTQRRGGMKCARTDFHVVGLQDHASPICPVLLQGEDQPLEGPGGIQITLMCAVAGAKFGFSHRIDTDS